MLHRGFFKEIFRQLKTAGIVLASILMLFNVGVFFNNASSAMRQQLPAVPSDSTNAFYMMLFIYVASLVLTFMAFNWLNRRSTSDFYHALPIKRAQIYWSTFLAVVLWVVIGITGYAVVHALLFLLMGLPFNYLSYLCVYLNMLIGTIQVVGVVSLACALSGTRFVNLFSAAVILFVPRALLMVLAGFVAINADYLPIFRTSFLFDPSFNLFATPYISFLGALYDLLGGYYESIHMSFTNAAAMLYSLVHACLIAFLGMIAFRHRPSESAGMPMRSRIIQGLIRTAFGLPLLLVVVALILEDAFSVSAAVILTLFAFTFYCLYELISTKSAKRMLRSMPLFTICIGIAVLYLFIPTLIVKISSSIKVSEETIVSVEFEDINFTANRNSYEAHTMQKIRLDDQTVKSTVAKAYRRTLEQDNWDSTRYMMVRIDRKSGGDLLRVLRFTDAEYQHLSDAIQRNPMYVETVNAYPKGIHYYRASGLTAAEQREIGRLFEEEFGTLSDADREIVKYVSFGSQENTKIFYQLQMRGVLGTDNYFNSYAITNLTPKTAQRYTELLYEHYNDHSKDHIRSMIQWMTHPDEYVEPLYLGNMIEIDPYHAYYDKTKATQLPKVAVPEYNEVLDILMNAEPAQNADEGVTVMFSAADYYGMLYTNFEVSRQYITLKITDEELARIQSLLEKYQKTDEYPETFDVDDIML